MEVAAGVQPLDLRFQDLIIRETAKIAAKDVSCPIKQQFNECQQLRSKGLTPLGRGYLLCLQLKKEADINNIAKEPKFQPGSLSRIIKKPDYWQTLGSSKSRTRDQQEKAQLLLQTLAQPRANSAIAFTDGSCLGNPGPCGAGAVVNFNHTTLELVQPVSHRGSILLAELTAILIVLEAVLLQVKDKLHLDTLQIFCDSQSAVGILTLNWSSKMYHSLISDIKERWKALSIAGVFIDLMWTPGHAGIDGNDIADKLAKEAAEKAQVNPPSTVEITLADVIAANKLRSNNIWQTRWELSPSDTGRELFKYKPDIASNCLIDVPSKRQYKIITQLRTGYSKLHSYQAKINKNLSPLCACGDVETVQHYLFNCPNYITARCAFREQIGRELGFGSLDMDTLLSFDKVNDSSGDRIALLGILGDFISNTGRFS